MSGPTARWAGMSDPVEDVVDRARSLLGRTLTAHGVSLRITEVEAYGGTSDPASHAYRRTARSEIMYGPPWRLYVYRSYGIHWCANIVTGPTEHAAAVLLRAGEVVDGIDLALERRSAPGRRLAPGPRLARGPGNLAQALGISGADLGAEVLESSSPVRLGAPPAQAPPVAQGPRVGVAQEADRPWRLWIPGDPTVSAYRRSPRAPATMTTDRTDTKNDRPRSDA